MAEVQRHATIAPFAVQHAAMEDTVFRGYKIPKHTMIQVNLAEVNVKTDCTG